MRKPARPREIPPPLELECLKALWTRGEANVRDVRDFLAPKRQLAYTTVMTLLDRLVRKGAAGRRKQGRAFVYAPVLSRDLLRRVAVKELVDSFFDGSGDKLLAYLRNEAVSQPEYEAVSQDNRLDTSLL